MKRIVFIQIGTGFFAVEIDQVKRFVNNVEIFDFGDKEEPSGIIGMICFYDEVIPVLDSYKWFGQRQVNVDKKVSFVIMMLDGKSFAFQISAVIESAVVPDECFQAITAFYGQGNTGVFKEVISWNGTLYLKINAETILKEMTANTKSLK